MSIIIPAYNEASRLPGTLEKVFAFLENQPYTSEVLVVENGSTDGTYRIAKSFQEKCDCLRVIKQDFPGKGKAVRTGMLQAHGTFRFMCDADLSMPIDELSRFLPPALEDFDVAIASREAPESVRYNEPFYRHLGGRLINTIIRLLALPGLDDTQCGFKCFRAEVAEDIFKHQKIDRWAFDVEVLFIAQKRGYRIVEIPISWYFNPETKLRPLRDALAMIIDIAKLKINNRRGFYDKED